MKERLNDECFIIRNLLDEGANMLDSHFYKKNITDDQVIDDLYYLIMNHAKNANLDCFEQVEVKYDNTDPNYDWDIYDIDVLIESKDSILCYCQIMHQTEYVFKKFQELEQKLKREGNEYLMLHSIKPNNKKNHKIL